LKVSDSLLFFRGEEYSMLGSDSLNSIISESRGEKIRFPRISSHRIKVRVLSKTQSLNSTVKAWLGGARGTGRRWGRE
jgi:hypothetical protein